MLFSLLCKICLGFQKLYMANVGKLFSVQFLVDFIEVVQTPEHIITLNHCVSMED